MVRAMTDAMPLQLMLTGPDQTQKLAERIAPLLTPGDVILLSGDIGAGKTHFARAVIQTSLTRFEDVPSPTFTLVQTYEGKHGDIWHADLYRLSSVDEIEELGLLDAFDIAICLVEWPDRLGPEAPQSALSLSFAMTETAGERVLNASWTHPRWNMMRGLLLS